MVLYTALKLHQRGVLFRIRLKPLWNYTALKHPAANASIPPGLRPLWNYTALKHAWNSSNEIVQFETPMELHCSQTVS